MRGDDDDWRFWIAGRGCGGGGGSISVQRPFNCETKKTGERTQLSGPGHTIRAVSILRLKR